MARRPTDLQGDTHDEGSDAPRAQQAPPAPPPPPPPPDTDRDARGPYAPPPDPRLRTSGNGGPPERPSPPRPTGNRPSGGGASASLRWVPWVVLGLVAAAFLISSLANRSSSKADLSYTQFEQQVQDGNV